MYHHPRPLILDHWLSVHLLHNIIYFLTHSVISVDNNILIAYTKQKRDMAQAYWISLIKLMLTILIPQMVWTPCSVGKAKLLPRLRWSLCKTLKTMSAMIHEEICCHHRNFLQKTTECYVAWTFIWIRDMYCGPEVQSTFLKRNPCF